MTWFAYSRKNIQGGLGQEIDLIEDHDYRKGVVFSRTGPESDHLIASLGVLNGEGDVSRTMVARASYTAIALHQGPLQMEADQIRIKLFGRANEPWTDDDYYDCFFNLDLANGFVFAHQQNQGLR